MVQASSGLTAGDVQAYVLPFPPQFLSFIPFNFPSWVLSSLSAFRQRATAILTAFLTPVFPYKNLWHIVPNSSS